MVDAVACAVAVQKAVADRAGQEPPEPAHRVPDRRSTSATWWSRATTSCGDGVNIAARLEQLCEPGGVLVSRHGVSTTSRAGSACRFEFTGEQQVKNIARPVETYPGAAGRGGAGRAGSARPQRWQRLALAAAAVAVRAGVRRAASGGSGRPRPPPGKPAIAVLPFDNLSGDARWERFADGITEDMITDLARDPDLHVIARNSTVAYKGKAVDVRQVGQELGVRYVLEGSLQAEPGGCG